MILAFLHLAFATPPPLPGTAPIMGERILGATEGSIGPIAALVGYIGFGLADYSNDRHLAYMLHSGLMGAGAFLTTDGWVRYSAAGQYRRAWQNGQDLEIARRRMYATIAKADLIVGGSCVGLGLTGLIWSPLLKAEAPGEMDYRFASESGAILLGEGLVMGAIGALNWFAPPPKTASLHVNPLLTMPGMEVQWSW